MHRNISQTARPLFLESVVVALRSAPVKAVDCTEFFTFCDVIPEESSGPGFNFSYNCPWTVTCAEVNPCLSEACGAGSGWDCEDGPPVDTFGGGGCMPPS